MKALKIPIVVTYSIICVLAATVVLLGLWVRQLQHRVTQLQETLDTNKVRSEICQLKYNLETYMQCVAVELKMNPPEVGNPSVRDMLKEMINSFERINSQKEKMAVLYGEKAPKIAESMESMIGTYRNWMITHQGNQQDRDRCTKEFEDIQADILRLKKEGYGYRRFIVARKFDTEAGRGCYECADLIEQRKVVLVADEDQVDMTASRTYAHGYGGQRFLVRREKEAPVTFTNALGASLTEYLPKYTALPSKNVPKISEEDLEKARQQANKTMDAIASAEQDTYRLTLESLIFEMKRLAPLL